MSTEKQRKFSIKIYIIPIIAIALLTAIDQLTKFIVTSSFELYESRSLIDGVFSLTYIRNQGMACGMFQGKRIIFLIMTTVILLLCFYVYSNIAGKKKYLPLRISLIILIAGAVGNMIDRFKLGYVIDFFDFELINFPVFNVADIYVVISMIFTFILLMFKYNNDEFDEILGFASKEDKASDKDKRCADKESNDSKDNASE